MLCRPVDAPESGPRGLKLRSRSAAVPGACHAGRWPSRPVSGWSKGGRAQEGDGAGKGAVMRCGGVYSAACREEVLKGDYKEASTGDMVRHDRGRALSRRPAGLPEGPCSPTRSGAAVAGRSAAVKVCRPPSTGSRPGRVGEASASGWRAVSTRLRRCGEGGYVGDLPLSQKRRRAPPSPAVCFFAGERATQAPIVRGGEGEARAFRRPRSRGKRHVAH